MSILDEREVLVRAGRLVRGFEVIVAALEAASPGDGFALLRVAALMEAFPRRWTKEHALFAARYFQWLEAVELAGASAATVGPAQATITRVMLARSLGAMR